MFMSYKYPTVNDKINKTVLWDIFIEVLTACGPLNVHHIVCFFSGVNRFVKNRLALTEDLAAVYNAQIYFCGRFFRMYRNDANLLRQLAAYDSVNEFLGGAYVAAAKTASNADVVALMKRLSGTYGFVLPTEDEMYRKQVELSERLPPPSQEQLRLFSDIQDRCLKKCIPVTMISVREKDKILVSSITESDYLNNADVDSMAIHCIVHATRKTGVLLVCVHTDDGNLVAGYESVDGDVSPMDPHRLQICASLFLPEKVKKAGWTCIGSLTALDRGY